MKGGSGSNGHPVATRNILYLGIFLCYSVERWGGVGWDEMKVRAAYFLTIGTCSERAFAGKYLDQRMDPLGFSSYPLVNIGPVGDVQDFREFLRYN